jgi:hypothetical protein
MRALPLAAGSLRRAVARDGEITRELIYGLLREDAG